MNSMLIYFPQFKTHRIQPNERNINKAHRVDYQNNKIGKLLANFFDFFSFWKSTSAVEKEGIRNHILLLAKYRT